MSDAPDPLGDIFTLFAAPIAGTVRTVEQFRRGVDEFLRAVENFNTTMENLNETTARINTLLAEVEEPLRTSIPQMTRSIKAADEMMKVVSGPAIALAPGMTRLAETLSTPAVAQLPNQLAQFNEMLAEMSRRLAPLAGLAGNAGGFLGGLRLPGFAGSPSEPSTEPPAAHDPADERAIVARVSKPAKRATTKKAASRSVGATRKRAPAKRSADKRR